MLRELLGERFPLMDQGDGVSGPLQSFLSVLFDKGMVTHLCFEFVNGVEYTRCGWYHIYAMRAMARLYT